jgi:hypothetical protein
MKFLIIVIALIGFSASVDRDNWKRCYQSSFCRRCRNVTGISPYDVNKSSLYTDSTRISVEIMNKENQHVFLMKLGALEVFHDCHFQRVL